MEKLVKLLNEYSPDYCKDYPDDIIMDEIVISKRFGFIKWLVDNDNIDLTKLYHDMRLEFGNYYWLLMQLSISDTPIQDLCVWLK